MAAQSQILIKADGDTLKLGNNLKSIRPTANNTVVEFITDSESFTIDIRDIEKLSFADTYTGINHIGNEKTTITYDAKEEKIIIINGDRNAETAIFNSKGMLVKKFRGNEASVKELAPGLYIVSYNRKINAKIQKK